MTSLASGDFVELIYAKYTPGPPIGARGYVVGFWRDMSLFVLRAPRYLYLKAIAGSCDRHFAGAELPVCESVITPNPAHPLVVYLNRPRYGEGLFTNDHVLDRHS